MSNYISDIARSCSSKLACFSFCYIAWLRMPWDVRRLERETYTE